VLTRDNPELAKLASDLRHRRNQQADSSPVHQVDKVRPEVVVFRSDSINETAGAVPVLND
jgi:hypothetical protein